MAARKRDLESIAQAMAAMKGAPERDPCRIWPILDLLGNVWQKHPNLRLGQLLVGLLGVTSPEVFYAEDAKLLELLKKRNTPGDGNVRTAERPPTESKGL